MMNENMIVYCYTSKINGKKYIGITINKLSKRHNEHINDSKLERDNCPFHNAIRKYGIENFSLSVLKKCETVEELKEYEKFYIKELNTFIHFENSNGYNATLGGDGACGINGENHPMYGRKGEKHPFYGKHHTDENKKKMSEIRKNNPVESSRFSGKHHTNESKKKISEASKGKNNPRCRKIAQYDLDGNFIKEWDYITQASDELKISRQHISHVCNGKRKTCGGFIWKYID